MSCDPHSTDELGDTKLIELELWIDEYLQTNDQPSEPKKSQEQLNEEAYKRAMNILK